MRIIHSLRAANMKNNLDEVYDLLDFLSETGDYHLDELQREYLKNIEHAIPYVKTFSDSSDDLEWPYMAEKIFSGTFPPDKLPAHLREFTMKMYYNKI